MGSEEAIEQIQRIIYYYESLDMDDEEEKDLESLNKAVSALEKQTPKKAKRYIDFNGIERNGCPACPRNEILYAGQEYCSVCGQKIDWEKEQKYRTLMMYIDKRNVKE